MYVKVVFRIKRYNYSSVVVNSSTQGISCLFGTYDVAKLDKYFTMGITNYSSTRQKISLYFI